MAGCATQRSVLNNCHWDNNVRPVKQGAVSHGTILGVFRYGDLTLSDAMRNGNIQKIHHVDFRWNHWLAWPIFWEETLIIYGE